MSRYQKGKTNLDFTEARDSEWQWRQLGHMQVCTSLQTDNHASTPPLKFFYRPDALPAAQPTAPTPSPQTYVVKNVILRNSASAKTREGHLSWGGADVCPRSVCLCVVGYLCAVERGVLSLTLIRRCCNGIAPPLHGCFEALRRDCISHTELYIPCSELTV